MDKELETTSAEDILRSLAAAAVTTHSHQAKLAKEIKALQVREKELRVSISHAEHDIVKVEEECAKRVVVARKAASEEEERLAELQGKVHEAQNEIER